ncbi:hypothetical protein SBDP1_40002 [Syntrophobacter sp. SbD1]|nr:hypothetical protein SBDP1_40002 [Syntrophobacter sp. SbD1]
MDPNGVREFGLFSPSKCRKKAKLNVGPELKPEIPLCSGMQNFLLAYLLEAFPSSKLLGLRADVTLKLHNGIQCGREILT